MRILLVSSGPSLTRQVTTALPTDADVLEVRTPERALAVLDEGEHTFDVIVGDADTHPTGGFVLVRDVKARVTDGAELPPVVLLIARPQDEYLCRWAQADAWVVKPVDPFDLAEVLAAFADGAEVPALPGVGVLGHPPRLGPGGGVAADRTPPSDAELGHAPPGTARGMLTHGGDDVDTADHDGSEPADGADRSEPADDAAERELEPSGGDGRD